MAYNANSPRLEAFNGLIFQGGIDMHRSKLGSDLGVFVAATAATFRAGQVVAQNSAGNIVVCDPAGAAPETIPFGIAKVNKSSSYYSTNVDEPITLNGTTVTPLKHAGLVLASAAVRSLPDQAGTLYTGGGTDYTLNTTNGTVARVGGGAIGDGDTVYVTYTWALTEADLQFQGRNFWNFTDDVTQQDNRITVIQDWSMIFSTMYDPSLTYAIGEILYVASGAKAGFLTNASGGGVPPWGRVMQLPTAEDPYMGFTTPGHMILSVLRNPYKAPPKRWHTHRTRTFVPATLPRRPLARRRPTSATALQAPRTASSARRLRRCRPPLLATPA